MGADRLTTADILARLRLVKESPSTLGTFYAACPVHDDRSPSLTVTSNNTGEPLVFCHRCEAGADPDGRAAWFRDFMRIITGATATDQALWETYSAKPKTDDREWTVVRHHVYRWDDRDQLQKTRYDLLDRSTREVTKAFAWRHNAAEAGRHPVWIAGSNGAEPLYKGWTIRPGEPVWLVEGERDAETLAATGVVAVSSPHGAGTPLTEAHLDELAVASIVNVVADDDQPGHDHAEAVAKQLQGITETALWLPPEGFNDITEADSDVHGLRPFPRIEPVGLAHVHEVYRRWLGESYDLDVLDVVLAVAAAEQLDGDPPWLLVVGGSGSAKTETVAPLSGAGALIVSTVQSEGALLSATSRKDTTRQATGGLLREVGDRGVVVIKDFTSIISMSREVRGQVLAALREVYDGAWHRRVGVDGGRLLLWEGRIVVIGAVTTAYDAAHGVIAAMGDRFVVVRMGSSDGRASSGRQALVNVGHEITMRAELAEAVGSLLAGVPTNVEPLDAATEDLLIGLADLVTKGRTAVERDYAGNVIDAHAPEAPTRFLKQLVQVVRGGLAIGMDQTSALRVAARAAGDSMPPLRLAVLGDVADHPGARTAEVTKRLQKPRNTIDRALQECHVLGLVVVDDTVTGQGWHYTLAPGVDLSVLDVLVSRNVSNPVQSFLSPYPLLLTNLDTESKPHPDALCLGCGRYLREGRHSIDCPRLAS